MTSHFVVGGFTFNRAKVSGIKIQWTGKMMGQNGKTLSFGVSQGFDRYRLYIRKNDKVWASGHMGRNILELAVVAMGPSQLLMDLVEKLEEQ